MITLRVDELTVKDLRRGVDLDHPSPPGVKGRSEPVTSRLVGVSADGILIFKSVSITVSPGTQDFYTQYVKLEDWEDMLSSTPDLDFTERANLVLFGDVKVSCNCPYFLYYGPRYMLTQMDACYLDAPDWEGNKGPEDRLPKVRNPRLKGTVCKHLSNALDIVPMSVSRLAGLLKKMQASGLVKFEEPEEKPVEGLDDEGEEDVNGED
jgi:hypothetical protein